MYLKDFAEQRNEVSHTIATYIRRHPEEFEGHTSMSGNRLVLDDYAVSLLDKVYPLPKPVEIINGVDPEVYQDSLQRLEKAKDLIIELQNKLTDTQLLLKDQETETKLLEAHQEAVINNAKERIEQANQEKKHLEEMYLERIKKAEQLHQEQLDAERTRKLTWMERLLGRKLSE